MSDRTPSHGRLLPSANLRARSRAPLSRIACAVAEVVFAIASPACHTTRVVAPSVGLRVAVTRHANTTTGTHLETSVALVAGASARPPLAPAVTQPIAKRRDAHRPAPCRVQALCAWELETAAVVAQVLAYEGGTPLAPDALGPVPPDEASGPR